MGKQILEATYETCNRWFLKAPVRAYECGRALREGCSFDYKKTPIEKILKEQTTYEPFDKMFEEALEENYPTTMKVLKYGSIATSLGLVPLAITLGFLNDSKKK